MYNIQVWIKRYWWIVDDNSGEWRTIHKDKERRREIKFKKLEDAQKYLTTMYPYVKRIGQRRIVKNGKVITQF